ncbi:MAG: translocase [Phycisphaerae bacterium]|nr:translocase [Phycisphaerae bacterium]
MSQLVTRYNVLFESLKARRRRPELPKGLDRFAAAVSLRWRQRRVSDRFLRAQAEGIDALRGETAALTDAALSETLRSLRELFVRGRQDDEAVRRGLAATREVARRETGEEPFPVQLIGALALYHGRIVEMLTGEGKTLTGSIAAPLLAWRHRSLHVFTVNDYLARRDAESRESIYRRCGLTVGAIQQEQEPAARYEVYAKSIVYGTPKQITADWLRDQIRLGRLSTPWAGRRLLDESSGLGGPMIPGLRAALVDEADAVMIDEGVVPLIIARSRREDDMAETYRQAAALASKLEEAADYRIDHLRRRAELTRRGRERVAGLRAGLSEPIWRAARRAEELVRQALVARHCYLLGRQYQVVDGLVVIVDEYTGRFLADRSWEHGLHQAVEAKQGVDITADRETLARMSFQRFFRMYPVLSGMTGTIADAAVELRRVYNRPIAIIPTNRPVIREAWPTRVFRTAEGKWNAIAVSIGQLHAQLRPVLVGTRSIQASEQLSAMLAARGLPHRVLNANHDKEEAELIVSAGAPGVITVATNMAGRGTDIRLTQDARRAGGLHVLLTEVHGAKRIDRQFIGRSGRQGDPGSSQIFVSLEDELVRLHAPRLAALLSARTGADELSGRLLRLGVLLARHAQRRSEARDRWMRAEVLRQDDWTEKYLPGH